jgi:hypothetical protein
MSNLFRVHVEARDGHTALLRLRIRHLDEITFPVSPSFVMMLLEDESCPGHERYRAWQRGVYATDEDFDTAAHLVSIRLLEKRGLPREQGEPPAGMTRDDVDESEDPGVLGEALYEIVVDAGGMIGHLEVGDAWGTTAYDEAGNGPIYLGGGGDPTEWRREEGLTAGAP